MVFLRHTPDLREFIVRNKLKSCDPVDLKLRTEKPTIEDYHAASGEITSRFCDPERPRNARALYLLGLLQLRATEMAEEELEKEWEDNLRRHQEETQKRLRAAQEDAPAPSAENQPAPQQPGADSPFADRGSQDVRERRARVEEVRRQATIILQRMAGRYTTDRAQVAGGFVNQVKDAVVDLPKLAPNIPESHYLQALCFSRLSTDFYVSSALDAVRKAVRLDPGYLAPRVLLAQLLAASKKESEVLAARAEWKRVLDIDPGNAQARLGLAQMEVAIVGWNEAVKLLEPLAASADGQTPLRSQILRTLAAAYELTDNYEKAAECVARLHEDSRSALFPEGDVSLKAYLDIIEDVRPAGKAGGAPE
jgi:tetratricopeptide (TPR) repeat protein